MALSKQTCNKHNLKRAEVFAEHGLGDHDVALAHPDFQGYGEATCILCGKQNLRWMFAIRFDAPDLTTALGKVSTGLVRTEEVTLSVVGSTCINDWLDAVPESAEKLEALKRWDHEMGKLKAAKKLKVCEDLCAELCEMRGFEIPEDETARDEIRAAYWTVGHLAKSVLSWQNRKQLKNITKVVAGTCVRKTAQTALGHLVVVLDKQAELDGAKAEAPAPTPTPTPTAGGTVLDHDLTQMKDPAEGELVQRTRDAWDAGQASLNDWERTTLTDIGAKVVQYRSFASGNQKGLYTKLLDKLEQGANPAPVTTTTTTTAAIPGAVDYVSASGIVGARY